MIADLIITGLVIATAFSVVNIFLRENVRMSSRFTYYDGRSVIQRSSMREIEGALSTLGLPVQVAKFPSGHKVWRVCCIGAAPTIRFETEEYGEVAIEPSYDYTLDALLNNWKDIKR